MTAAGPAGPIVKLAEAQAYARIEAGEEEALLAGLVRSASGVCEAFLGQVVIQRPFTEQCAASSQWQRLQVAPVRSIDQLFLDGVELPAALYATDIDASGCGWVRLTGTEPAGVVSVSGTAGMAVDENGVQEPIRQGVLRLVAHLFNVRDGEGGDIPAAVTALWRPYRRMRLS